MIKNMGLDPDAIENTSELHGNECILRIKLTKHETYGASNLIERYLPVSVNLDSDIPYELIVDDMPGPAPAVYEPETDEKTYDIPMV